MDSLGYDAATRDLLGQRLAHMMYRQIFEFHAVHADPNPANYAFRTNGDVVLYDFGCVKVLPEQVAVDYRDFMCAMRDRDHVAMQKGMERLGLQRPGAQVPDQADLYSEIRATLAPFLFEDQTFEFGTASNHVNFMRLLTKGLRRPKQFQPSSSILFTDRAQGGNYTNMMHIGCRFNMHRIYRDYLGLSQLGDPGYAERMQRVPERPPV
jgi:predicted unusual protein kinase regulating ubiquinone biosynthesis (AarF/ABC1/UbiB family)